MFRTLLLLLIIASAFASCFYDSYQGLHPLNGYQNPCDTSLQATYSSAVKLIISYNCISCHNSSYAGGSVTLDSYDQLKANCVNGKLMNCVLRNTGYNPMPPTQALESCQVQQLQLWISNNYPQ
jgi:hypothetical protein